MNFDRPGEEFPRYPHFRKQEFLCFCFFFASGNLRSIHKSFFNNRLQRVVLNSQYSSVQCASTNRVPQCSILGLLLFLIYQNDLPGNLQFTAKLFDDDISLFLTQPCMIIIESNLEKNF